MNVTCAVPPSQGRIPKISTAVCRTAVVLIAMSAIALAQQTPYDIFPSADPPYYRVRYDGSAQPGELMYPVNYTVWIPPNVKSLRGVIVHQHGCGEGSCKSGLTGAFDLHWQALAKKHDCALLAPAYEQPEKADCQMWCDPRNGSAAAFRKCLVDLGAKSGHPELATVPWALWGHSGGGHWAGGMVLLYPERVAAAWLRSGVPLLKPDPERPGIKAHTLPKAALKVPVMCNLGTKEGLTVKDGRFAGVWPANEAFFSEIRSQGGLISVAVDPLTSHECGNQRYFAVPWLDACLSARLPKAGTDPLKDMPTEDAWLAEPTGSTAVPAAKFAGDPLKAAWLPKESIARAWMQYVKDTAVIDTTPPPAPTNLRVSGNELSWEAEADLESGLAGFIIERDGQFLANVPEQGKNPFGRPIFQNLQYSDTPTQPLVPLRFTDTKAGPGTKHTYRVIAVNTVGLKSAPSADSVAAGARHAMLPKTWTSALLLSGWLSAMPIAAPAAGAEAALQADFEKPPAAFQTRPLWFWNGPLEKQKTTEIMEHGRDSGYAGFGILPCHAEPKFMSPEFLDQYAHAVDEAARLGLKMCLYDEYWFPSGSAGGQLAELYPEALSRRLDLDAHDVDGPAKVQRRLPPGELMAAVAMHAKTFERVNLTGHIRDGVLAWDAPAGPWKVMIFTCVPDGARGLVNYLDPTAVQNFISLTYEKYYARFPSRFGSTIDSAFYDEPTMHWLKGGRAWTPEFNRWFIGRHGFDPALLYPALWFDIGPETAAARNTLFGFRADLYADGFVKTIADWCRRHGIGLTGHQDQEEVVNPVGLCGDLMKSMRDQDIPGVDQIAAYGRGSRAYKVISSIACNYDRPLVMTECYGAMKAMPVPNLYREAMDQFAKGINLMVPHAVWYDTGKVMFDPELSWRTPPYAAELPSYNRYMARLQRMLQGGRHVADVGVLYPIATLQAGYHFDGPLKPYDGGVIPPEADYMAVGERLTLDVRRDFTFLHPEVLDAKCTVDGPTLRLNNRVNDEQYRIVVIPGSRAIHASNLAKIRDFYEQGGVVLATTRLPEYSAEAGKDAEVRDSIAAMFDTAAQADTTRVTASSTWAAGGHDPELAVDGDPDTRWNTAANTGGNQWLEIEFDSPRTFCRTVVREAFDRTRAYRIESWDGSRWVECARGQRLGDEKIDTFAPVSAKKVRLFMETIASDCVSVREFEVLDGKGANLAQTGAAFSVRTHAKGGRAYFLPRPTAAAIQGALDDAELVPDVRWEEPVRVSGGNLSYIHKVLDGREIWFFGNSSDTRVETAVRLRGRHVLERWDPHTGTIETQPAEAVRDGDAEVTRVRLSLGPVRSVFLVGAVSAAR